jgi:hypothetical protein
VMSTGCKRNGGVRERFPKARYLTAVESWRHLQSDNIEFTMKRLREPIEDGGERADG